MTIKVMRYKFSFLIYILMASYSLSITSFANEIRKCPDGQHWVKAHHRKSYIKGDGTKVAASNVKSHCKTDIRKYNLWANQIITTPIRSWPFPKEKQKGWSIDEQERLLESLDQLPPFLTDYKIKFYRFDRSRIFQANPASGTSEIIVLYDEAFSSKQNLSRIVAHELAHEVYRLLSNKEKDSYRDAAEWLLLKNPNLKDSYQLITNREPETYVEPDGSESVGEDFSNNLEYFLFDPKTLMTRASKIHN